MPRARPVASGSDVIRMDKPKKKGGCVCGGSCSSCKKTGRLSRQSPSPSKMDRADALTPTEYLAACDLGIQGRSRSYIRARLDAASLREDMPSGKGGKKCGNSTIPANKQCRSGGGVGSTVAKGALATGVAVGAYKGGEKLGAAIAKRGGVKAVSKKVALKTATAAGSAYGKAKRTVGTVRRGGAVGVASAAGRNTARAQNAVGKVAANVRRNRAVRTGKVGAKRALRKVSSMIGR